MFIDPKDIIDRLSLSGNEIVVDLGTGSGAYAIECAKRLAEKGGKVYAVDVQQDLLTRLSHTADEAHLSNISYVHADIEKKGGVHLKERIADLVIVSNVLYCATDRVGVLGEAARLLRDGGRLLLVDWSGPFRGMGPDEKQVITKATGEKLALQGGFVDPVELPAGDHHWALLLSRKGGSAVTSGFMV